MKVGAVYHVIKKHRVSRVHRKAGVLSDQTILLGQCSTRMVSPVRLVSFQAPDGNVYDYITNRFDLSALTIAELYRARWGIEIFFKWLKRTLRMERPLGRSAIAYEMHVLMTLITDILLKIFSSLPPARRHTPIVLLRLIRENLFSRLSKELIRCIIQLGQTWHVQEAGHYWDHGPPRRLCSRRIPAHTVAMRPQRRAVDAAGMGICRGHRGRMDSVGIEALEEARDLGMP